MSFFEQELIRDELTEMSSLYEEVVKALYGPDKESTDTRIECLCKLERLVELQKLLYFRAKYSQDREAEEFVDMIRTSASFLGIPPDMDLTQIFSQMKQDIATAKKRLDKSS